MEATWDLRALMRNPVDFTYLVRRSDVTRTADQERTRQRAEAKTIALENAGRRF